MQVSAQPRHVPFSGKYRSQASDSVASIAMAIEHEAGRAGGQPGGSSREERHAAPDQRTDKSGHKTVFVARSLSSTLTELQIASVADEFGAALNRVDMSPPPAASADRASLDDLLSVFLSAA